MADSTPPPSQTSEPGQVSSTTASAQPIDQYGYPILQPGQTPKVGVIYSGSQGYGTIYNAYGSISSVYVGNQYNPNAPAPVAPGPTGLYLSYFQGKTPVISAYYTPGAEPFVGRGQGTLRDPETGQTMTVAQAVNLFGGYSGNSSATGGSGGGSGSGNKNTGGTPDYGSPNQALSPVPAGGYYGMEGTVITDYKGVPLPVEKSSTPISSGGPVKSSAPLFNGGGAPAGTGGADYTAAIIGPNNETIPIKTSAQMSSGGADYTPTMMTPQGRVVPVTPETTASLFRPQSATPAQPEPTYNTALQERVNKDVAYYKPSDIGDVKTRALEKAGVPLTIALERQREESLDKGDNRAALYYQNELTKALTNNVVVSSDYHHLAMESNLPQPANPYEYVGDISLAILSGSTNKNTKNLPPESVAKIAPFLQPQGIGETKPSELNLLPALNTLENIKAAGEMGPYGKLGSYSSTLGQLTVEEQQNIARGAALTRNEDYKELPMFGNIYEQKALGYGTAITPESIALASETGRPASAPRVEIAPGVFSTGAIEFIGHEFQNPGYVPGTYSRTEEIISKENSGWSSGNFQAQILGKIANIFTLGFAEESLNPFTNAGVEKKLVTETYQKRYTSPFNNESGADVSDYTKQLAKDIENTGSISTVTNQHVEQGLLKYEQYNAALSNIVSPLGQTQEQKLETEMHGSSLENLIQGARNKAVERPLDIGTNIAAMVAFVAGGEVIGGAATTVAAGTRLAGAVPIAGTAINAGLGLTYGYKTTEAVTAGFTEFGPQAANRLGGTLATELVPMIAGVKIAGAVGSPLAVANKPLNWKTVQMVEPPTLEARTATTANNLKISGLNTVVRVGEITGNAASELINIPDYVRSAPNVARAGIEALGESAANAYDVAALKTAVAASRVVNYAVVKGEAVGTAAGESIWTAGQKVRNAPGAAVEALVNTGQYLGQNTANLLYRGAGTVSELQNLPTNLREGASAASTYLRVRATDLVDITGRKISEVPEYIGTTAANYVPPRFLVEGVVTAGRVVGEIPNAPRHIGEASSMASQYARLKYTDTVDITGRKIAAIPEYIGTKAAQYVPPEFLVRGAVTAGRVVGEIPNVPGYLREAPRYLREGGRAASQYVRLSGQDFLTVTGQKVAAVPESIARLAAGYVPSTRLIEGTVRVGRAIGEIPNIPGDILHGLGNARMYASIKAADTLYRAGEIPGRAISATVRFGEVVGTRAGELTTRAGEAINPINIGERFGKAAGDIIAPNKNPNGIGVRPESITPYRAPKGTTQPARYTRPAGTGNLNEAFRQQPKTYARELPETSRFKEIYADYNANKAQIEAAAAKEPTKITPPELRNHRFSSEPTTTRGTSGGGDGGLPKYPTVGGPEGAPSPGRINLGGMSNGMENFGYPGTESPFRSAKPVEAAPAKPTEVLSKVEQNAKNLRGGMKNYWSNGQTTGGELARGANTPLKKIEKAEPTVDIMGNPTRKISHLIERNQNIVGETAKEKAAKREIEHKAQAASGKSSTGQVSLQKLAQEQKVEPKVEQKYKHSLEERLAAQDAIVNVRIEKVVKETTKAEQLPQTTRMPAYPTLAGPQMNLGLKIVSLQEQRTVPRPKQEQLPLEVQRAVRAAFGETKQQQEQKKATVQTLGVTVLSAQKPESAQKQEKDQAIAVALMSSSAIAQASKQESAQAIESKFAQKSETKQVQEKATKPRVEIMAVPILPLTQQSNTTVQLPKTKRGKNKTHTEVFEYAFNVVQGSKLQQKVLGLTPDKTPPAQKVGDFELFFRTGKKHSILAIPVPVTGKPKPGKYPKQTPLGVNVPTTQYYRTTGNKGIAAVESNAVPIVIIPKNNLPAGLNTKKRKNKVR